jgi:hypothetical protein
MGRANSQAGEAKTAEHFCRRGALNLRPIGRASGSATVSAGFSMSNATIETTGAGFTCVKKLFYA